jgi:hypothetical protein
MEGEDNVPAEASSLETDVSYDTNQSPSGNKNPVSVLPHFRELTKESLIVIDMT